MRINEVDELLLKRWDDVQRLLDRKDALAAGFKELANECARGMQEMLSPVASDVEAAVLNKIEPHCYRRAWREGFTNPPWIGFHPIDTSLLLAGTTAKSYVWCGGLDGQEAAFTDLLWKKAGTTLKEIGATRRDDQQCPVWLSSTRTNLQWIESLKAGTLVEDVLGEVEKLKPLVPVIDEVLAELRASKPQKRKR